jgi:hypothetical protein
MTDSQADRTRAWFLPFFAALMLWNSMTAHSARNQWFAAVAALFFAGTAGWFLAEVYARPPKLWDTTRVATDGGQKP